MALYRRRPAPEVIHRSAPGQYTAVLFGTRSANAGIEIPMGSVRDCYDSAVCETFQASIKKERIFCRSWPTRAEVRTAVFEYIEGWYNPRRRHSTLGYLSPAEYEREHAQLATDPVCTAGVTIAGNGSICAEPGLGLSTDLAQPATDAGQGTNGTPWPVRSVVTEQTH
jgi:putative transposase